ncbi:MAG: hypothetical protein AB7K09_20750 [Planctomycetota bacterium]
MAVVVLLAGCGPGAAPTASPLQAEREASPAVAALLDGTAAVTPVIAVADEASVPPVVAEGDADSLAARLAWRLRHQPDDVAASGLLGADLTRELGSDWRLRREFDVPVAGPADGNTDAVYADVAERFRAIAADRLGVPSLTIAHLQSALIRLLTSAGEPPRAAALELLGEVLAAQQQRYLAYRAWRLALREYVKLAASLRATPDAQWEAAFGPARDGDLAAVNRLLAHEPDAPGAAWLKRAEWCAWFMRQVRGDVGTDEDRWFSEIRIRHERGEAVGELVDEPPPAAERTPLPAPVVAALVTGGLLLLVLVIRWRLRRPVAERGV